MPFSVQPVSALDEKQEAVLIDCLTAAHVVYLNFSIPEGVVLLLGGYNTVASTMTSWPQRAKSFFLIASEFIKRSAEKNKRRKIVTIQIPPFSSALIGLLVLDNETDQRRGAKRAAEKVM